MASVDFLDSRSSQWLREAQRQLAVEGYAVVTGVVNADLRERTREKMYLVQEKIINAVGKDRLERARELGVLRLPMKYDPVFFRYLELPEVLDILNATVTETSILHLQNGFILPSMPESATPAVSQNTYHMDFPRVLNGYMCSVNTFFAIDEFSVDNGCTHVVPRSHQSLTPPTAEEMARQSIPLECPAGAMIVFDSTLWHAAGKNTSGKNRLALNQQFTRSYIKQQIDYVRALGEELVTAQAPRTQQLLGWYTRVVTSLDEYYQPEERRLYRRHQG